MRVAIGLVSLLAGGAEYQMVLLADGLRRRGHAVTFYCTEAGETESMLRPFAPFPVRISRRLPRPFTRLATIALWRSWLHRDRITHAIGALGYPHAILSVACLGTRVSLVARRSCVWAEIREIGMYAQAVGQLSRMQHRLGWRTTAIVCNARAAARSAIREEGWPEEKVHVIRNGWPEMPAITWLNDTPWYCARPREEKAVDLATQEFAKADVPLALSFDPPDWSQVGILAHASRADACSNAVGMAMAHAIPVAAFDLPGMRELTGGKIELAPCFDYGELIKRVAALRALPSLRQQEGLIGQEFIRTHYALDRMVDQWDWLLEGARD